MTTTILSENIIAMVSQLADLQVQKEELQERTLMYEHKLNMIRDADLALNKEEQKLVTELQKHGFQYQDIVSEPLVTEVTPVTEVELLQQLSSGIYNFPQPGGLGPVESLGHTEPINPPSSSKAKTKTPSLSVRRRGGN